MKSYILLCFLIFGFLVLSNSCQKDEIRHLLFHDHPELLKLKSWNEKQKKFFNIKNSALTNTAASSSMDLRTEGTNMADSSFVRFYNKLVMLDEENDIVAKIADVTGYPFWQKAVVIANGNEQTSTFYLPLGFETGTRTEALISALEYEQNGVKRYSFKLSQRKEIEEVFADTSKISKYNNFGMEVLFFVYNDYFTYQANYQGFADAFLS